jgi:hypothetical protein
VKHEMLKTENPIIFTCFEDESYFFCFTFTNNKRVLFSASANGRVICVDASTSIIFRYFLLLCLRIFLFSHNKWKTDNATFIWCTVIEQHQLFSNQHIIVKWTTKFHNSSVSCSNFDFEDSKRVCIWIFAQRIQFILNLGSESFLSNLKLFP